MSPDQRAEASPAEVADMSAVVGALHSSYGLTTTVTTSTTGAVTWTATLTGEDFLDGPWEKTRTGTATTPHEALLAAARAFVKVPTVRTRLERLFRR